ncbi:cytochrome-c peroxidase [Maribacter sp. R77961]|uniref:cytochrome-c peroxidase n=1 Tax=Maribacter sp. R77961 TaxID=3093871 RepID=UPI0037CAC901
MKFNYIVIFILICFLGSSCQKEKEITRPKWEKAQNLYLQAATNCALYLDTLSTLNPTDSEAKRIFILARQEFKKAEPYASYLNPEVGHRANGPALPVYKEDTGKIMKPFGLQKIEESIYDGTTSEAQFKVEVRMTKGLLKNLTQTIASRPLTSQRFFIAVHQQLLRIVSHGISGFDTPVSHLGISETAISLENLKKCYELTLAQIIKDKSESLDSSFVSNINKAINYIEKNEDFDSFDRFVFIRDYFNPITRDWTAIRNKSGEWKNVDNKPFNFEAATFFENNSFNKTYFTPPIERHPTLEKIVLGKRLFMDKKLAANGKMACVTCHNPEKAYADGLTVNQDNSQNPLERNTPTLINSIYQKNFFWDGRSPTLNDQISAVFTNKKEFNATVHQFSDKILQDTLYEKMFKNVFGDVHLKNTHIIKAISAYVGTLNGFNSKFDRNIRGEQNTFTNEEKLGMNLFMGKALCATCHFMPLTNGTVPPFYTETEKEVIGVPNTKNNRELDDDLGFFWRFEEELHRGMFKTPTVRNVEVTAPYMHNGVYATLEEVMDFYNKGGGAGMGFDLERQTLPFDELNLTKKEQMALVAFVKTLTDVNVDKY